MEILRKIEEQTARVTHAATRSCRRALLGLALLALAGAASLMADPPSQASADIGQLTDWYLAGTRLDSGAVEALEKQVASNPGDLEARMKILGFYSPKRITQKAAQAAIQPHILWIIRNLPDSAAAGRPEVQIIRHIDPAHYEEARAAWNEQLAKQPGNPQLLGNAAAFFLLNDMPLAEKLLRQAQTLDPKNPEWAERLGFLFSLKGNHGAGDSDDRRQSLEFYEAALPPKDYEKKDKRFYQLAAVAQAAFDAGNFVKARAYSEELLGMASGFKNDWNYGNAVYTGNSILGLVALTQNDVPAARAHLLAAGETPGSPQLDSFGPNLTLARQLLERGEKEAVVQFLDHIAKFWKGRKATIKEWQEAIRQGRTPVFDRQ